MANYVTLINMYVLHPNCNYFRFKIKATYWNLSLLASESLLWTTQYLDTNWNLYLQASEKSFIKQMVIYKESMSSLNIY